MVCIIMLGFILFRMTRSAYLNDSNRSFSQVVASLIVVLALDAIASTASGTSLVISLIANSSFLFWTGVTGLSWFHYTEIALERAERTRTRRVIEFIPVTILAVICFASIWTGWVFTVDPETVIYHRGPFHFAQVALAAFYLITAAGLTLREFSRTKSVQRRRELMTLIMFSLMTAIGSILDVFIYGIPFTWTLCTVGAVMVFVNYQEYSISTDGLTGLNNRRHFESHALAMVEEANAEHPVFLLLMDIDGFKAINDVHGHRMGDAALVQVASILKRVVGDRHILIARYGGDEFALLGELPSEADAVALKAKIGAEFDEYDRNTTNPYHLKTSIGVAWTDGSKTKTVDDLVNLADKRLYSEKSAHLGKQA